MQVYKRSDGTFRVVLNVSAEERENRKARALSRKQAADDAAEALLRELPRRLREYVEPLGRYGAWSVHEAWFRNQGWLQSRGISQETANQVLHGIDVCRQAEIERGLALSTMPHAKAALAKVLLRAGQ
jgi:hypothetical protein